MAIVLAALSLLGLGIFGPGIASGIVSGGPQLSAGAAVGTGLAAGGMVAAGAGAVGAVASGGAALAGGAAAAARGGAAMAGGASTAYSLGAAGQSGAAGVASRLGRRCPGRRSAPPSAAAPCRLARRRKHAFQLQRRRQDRLRSDGRHPPPRARSAVTPPVTSAAAAGSAAAGGPPPGRKRMRRSQHMTHAVQATRPCRPLRRRPWRRLLRQPLRRRPLMFKRPSTHYGKAPEPETPYQRAAQVWDERIGTSRVQAKNWRLMALRLADPVAPALPPRSSWQSARGTIVPWVVQVDRLGQAQAVAPGVADYRPTDPQIAFHLARFIEQVRSIPADAIIVRQNWLRAYDFTTDRGAAGAERLRAGRTIRSPRSAASRSPSMSPASSARRPTASASPGSSAATRTASSPRPTRWTAILTIVVQIPRNADRLRANPLGIYVNAINWSRELGQ